jgi:hypothetical protein
MWARPGKIRLAGSIPAHGLPSGAIRYNGEVFSALPGIWRRDYQDYFNDDTAWFATAAYKAAPYNHNEAVNTINEPELQEYTSIELKGYFLASYTGTHTFYLACDDGGWMWLGPTALSGYTTSNALVKNGSQHGVVEVSATIDLVKGTYYPLRIQFGNYGGPGTLEASYSWSGQSKSNNWTGKIFYRAVTQGF